MDDVQAREAAKGWGGDTYLVYWNAELAKQSLFLMRSQWDTVNDANEFWDAMVEYGKARWGTPEINNSNFVHWIELTEGEATITRNGNDILWLISPKGTYVEAIISDIPDF